MRTLGTGLFGTLACVFGLWAGQALAAEPTLPEITISKCANPPVIDGQLDDPCWKTATPAGTFHVIKEGGTSAKHKAWVTYDNEWLYVAFDVAQSTLERDKTRYFKHDENIQREDNVQVSFDPGTDGELYYQFLVNKANTRADFRMTRAAGRERENWNIPWRSATRETETGWQVEIALPFSLILTHGDPSKARFNLIIDTFLLQRDAQMARMGVKKIEFSWAPIIEQFHEPEHFGRILGIQAADLRAPFLPFVTAAQVAGYEMKDGQYTYGVLADVQALSGRSGKVRFDVEDQPLSGKATETRETVDIQGNRTEKIRVAVPVQSLSKRTAVLSMCDAASGEVLQRITLDETSALDLFSAYLDRNYYTSEDAAVAVCRIGLPENTLKGMSLVVTDKAGRTVAQQKDPQPRTDFRIPLAGLPLGMNALVVELHDKEGAVSTRQEVSLLKKAPQPGCEVKVNRVDRTFLKDGKPFFPFGLLMDSVFPESEWAFQEVSEMGFNTVVQWYPLRYAKNPGIDPVADMRNYLDMAAKYNLEVIACPDGTYSKGLPLSDPNHLLQPGDLDSLNARLKDSGSLNVMKALELTHPALTRLSRSDRSTFFTQLYESNLPRMVGGVEGAKNHPNLFAYFLFDEPIIVEFEEYIAGRDWNRRLHELDGYHPTLVLYSSEIPPGIETVDWCDGLGTDPYWVPGTSGWGTRGTVNFVSKIVSETKRRADEMREVTYTVEVMERWSATKKRPLMPVEQACQTYLALIHGSKGILYFHYPFFTRSTNAEMKVLTEQMKTLGPICLTPDVPQEVSYSPGVLNPAKDQFTDVQVSLRKDPAGGYVLICANTAWCPVDTSFTVSLLGRDGVVTRLFAEDKYPVKDAAFDDRIEAMGTRAYKIAGPDTVTAPVAISVKMTPLKDQTRYEDIQPELATGKRNILPNASFEETAVPGWPNFYQYTGSPLVGEERVGGKEACWSVVEDHPFHGQKCLKMVVKKGMKIRRATYKEFYLVSDVATDYVLSVYLRANREGASAVIDLRSPTDRREKQVALTTEWKRYDIACPVPAKNSSESHFFVWVGDPNVRELPEDTIVWMDAIQIEKGSEPTEFQP